MLFTDMNNKFTYSVILCALLALVTSSCADFGDMNNDPNKPTIADPQLLLTNVEWELCRGISKDPLYVTRVLVQSDGESSLVNYRWDRSGFGAYTGVLKNVEKMREEATAQEKKSYIALAHFFRALAFFDLTLTLGDIPYSDALKGESDKIYAPKYDTQKEVLLGILNELETAEKILRQIPSGEHIKGDILCGGSPVAWIKGVNSFRLKVLMMLSKKENELPNIKSQFSQIVSSGMYIKTNEDNIGLNYIDRQGNRYPLFNDSGFGSGMYMDSTFIALMGEKKDPRLFTFVTRTKNAEDENKAIDDFTAYEGGDPIKPYSTINDKAVAGNISKPHKRFYQSPTNEPRVLLGAPEVHMIIAEGIVRGWVNGNAEEHYAKGIQESFNYYREHVKEYEAYLTPSAADKYIMGEKVSLASAISKEEKINRIITQIYIVNYFSGQWTAYYNHLRTGYPKFRLQEGKTIPTRFMYPQSEYNNNPDNVKEAIERQFGAAETIHSPVWWLK